MKKLAISTTKSHHRIAVHIHYCDGNHGLTLLRNALNSVEESWSWFWQEINGYNLTSSVEILDYPVLLTIVYQITV